MFFRILAYSLLPTIFWPELTSSSSRSCRRPYIWYLLIVGGVQAVCFGSCGCSSHRGDWSWSRGCGGSKNGRCGRQGSGSIFHQSPNSTSNLIDGLNWGPSGLRITRIGNGSCRMVVPSVNQRDSGITILYYVFHEICWIIDKGKLLLESWVTTFVPDWHSPLIFVQFTSKLLEYWPHY